MQHVSWGIVVFLEFNVLLLKIVICIYFIDFILLWNQKLKFCIFHSFQFVFTCLIKDTMMTHICYSMHSWGTFTQIQKLNMIQSVCILYIFPQNTLIHSNIVFPVFDNSNIRFNYIAEDQTCERAGASGWLLTPHF